MKTYEKPKLMVLSISANDALCTGCGHTTKDDDLLDFWDANKNGYLDEDDFGKIDGMFTVDAESCGTPYYGYCKYASADEGLPQLFTS